jgi:hypothetical protein
VPFRAGDTYVGTVTRGNEKATLGEITNQSPLKPIRLLGDGFYDQQGEKLLAGRDTVKRDPLTGDWHLVAQPAKVVARRLGGSFSNTVGVWKSLLCMGGGTKSVCRSVILIVLAILTFVHWVNARAFLGQWWRRIPAPYYAALLGAGAAVAIFAKPVVYKAFIYFQF